MDAAVTALANEFAPDLITQALIDAMIVDERETLSPGTDWQNNHIWMTIPLDLPDKRKVGRGKDAREEAYQRRTTILLCDNGRAIEYTAENVNSLGYAFPTIFYHQEKPRWQPADMRNFMQRPQGPTGQELFRELREIYLEYLDFQNPVYYDLLPIYILTSYVFRIFSAIGYLHFNGTAASGKSQNLTILDTFSLNSKFTSGATLSPLFRAIAAEPGLICFDEAESFNNDEGKEIKKMLNQGYRRGASMLRSEKPTADGAYQPVLYPVYSPKALASIAIQDPVLSSRCLVVPMLATMRRIPEFNDKEPRWQLFRNRIYRWALTSGRDVALGADDWNNHKRHTEVPHLRNRHWQIVQIFYAFAEANGLGELIPSFTAFFTDYFKNSQSQNARIDQTIRALPHLLRTVTPGYGSDYYSLKSIHEIVTQFVEEDELDSYKTRHISSHLRTSGFRTVKQTTGGLHFQIQPDEVLDRLQRRQLEPFEGDEDWYSTVAKAVPLQNQTLDWLDKYTESEEPD